MSKLSARTLRNGLTALCVLGLFVSGAAVAAHHLNGNWVFSVSLDDGNSGQASIYLEEGEGGKLTGTYSGALGQEDLSGTVSGSQIQISFDSQAGKVSFAGEYADGRILGTCTYGQLGGGTFEGVKKE